MACSLKRWKWLNSAILVACFGLLLTVPASVHAANPTTISFQGKVVNANGTNVADGSYGFVFKIYTVSSGGSAVWTETDTLTVSAGVFQVNLGAVCPFFTANACNGSTPIDFNANPNLYLGITFNSDPAGEMSPRVQLQSVPFAYNADKVGGFTASQLVQLSPGVQQGGFINVNGAGTFGGAINVTGLATLSGGGTLAGAFNLTYSSGVSGSGHSVTATNTNVTATTETVNGEDITLAGHANTTNANVLNGIKLENVTAIANNTFNALDFGTGYTSLVVYNGNPVINGTGVLVGSINTGSAIVAPTTTNTINGAIINGGAITGTTLEATTAFNANGTSGTGVTCGAGQANLGGAYSEGILTTAGTCTTVQAAGNYLIQAPTASTGAGSDDISPASAVIGLTVNGAAGTAAVAMDLNQSQGADGEDIAISNGTGTVGSAVSVTKTGAGALTNDISLVATTATGTGVSFSGAGGFTNLISDGAIFGVSGAGNITTTGTYNTNTFTSTALQFAGGASTVSTSSGALTIQGFGGASVITPNAATSNGITIQSGNATTGGNNAGTILVDTGTFSGAGTGTVSIGTAHASTVTIGNTTAATVLNLTAGATSGINLQQNTTVASGKNLTLTSGTFTVNTAAANQMLLTSGTNVPTVDQFDITNTGSTGVVTGGVNGLDISYKGGAAAVESAAERIDLQPGTTTGGTWSGLRVVPNATGAATGVTENGLKVDPITTPGTGTQNALYVGAGWNNVLSYNGNSVINGTGILQNFAFSPTTSYTNLAEVGALASGSIVSGFGTITTANTITGTVLDGTTGVNTGTGAGTQRIDNVGDLNNIASITANNSILDTDTGENVLALTGAPVNTATVSLVQLGGALVNGNITANGGTYLGINEPSTLAGSVADFAEFEANGVSKFNVDDIGDVTTTGGFSGGGYNPGQFSDAAVGTHTVATDALTYDLSSTSGTTGASFLTTFNITGLPTTDGTIAFITLTCAKGTTTGGVRTHTCVAQIGGVAVTQTLSASANGTAVTVTHSFTVARIAGVWAIVGTGGVQAAVGTTVSSSTTADYAEWIDFSGDAQPQPGDVLTVGSDPSSVTDSSTPYDPATLGVVSTTPFDVGGADDGHSVIIALTGRVPVNVNLANGPIKAGDPLTASSIPGQAMKATQPGRIIGIALSGYDGSQANNQVMVQLGVGYDVPASNSSTGSAQTNNSVITADLTSNGGGLDLDSGNNGDVSIDTSANQAAINIGTNNATGVSLSRDGQTTTVNGSLVIDQASTLKAAVNMDFSNNDSLNVATTGTGNGILVQQSNSGNTGGLSGALTIDNANTATPINTAIRITNTGGGGYTNLVTSPNFNVSGNGDVSASSLQLDTVSSNAFKVSDKQGATVVSIDDAGNASFAGALNLSDANLSGALNVGGDVNVGGLSTFQKLATFLAKTVFRQDVEFDGHITVASDTAGYASLRVGESTVHVAFAKAYDNPPVIDLSIVNGQFAVSSVNNVTDQGFDIQLQNPATAPTTFSWTALAVNNPQTATNPLPTSTSQTQVNSPAAKTAQP